MTTTATNTSSGGEPLRWVPRVLTTLPWSSTETHKVCLTQFNTDDKKKKRSKKSEVKF